MAHSKIFKILLITLSTFAVAEPRLGVNMEEEIQLILQNSKNILSSTNVLKSIPPPQVDNSNSKFFPPVANQGAQGSCNAFATGYYLGSYESARRKNIDISQGLLSEICSPSFIYHTINSGVDHGSSPFLALKLLSEIGCTSMELMPYKESDYVTSPTHEQYLDAFSRRTKHIITYSNYDTLTKDNYLDDSGLQNLKAHIAQGGLGVAVADVYAWWLYQKNTASLVQRAIGMNNGVIYKEAGKKLVDFVLDKTGHSTAHAMTIVGYDDNRQYSYWDNGFKFGRGAFLLVNSWGEEWGNGNTGNRKGGFFWVAYDMFKVGKSSWGYVVSNEGTNANPPLLFVEAKYPNQPRVVANSSLEIKKINNISESIRSPSSSGGMGINNGVLYTTVNPMLIGIDSIDSIQKISLSITTIDNQYISTSGFNVDLYYDLSGSGKYYRKFRSNRLETFLLHWYGSDIITTGAYYFFDNLSIFD